MQNQIIPIDILERFENENDVSVAPSSDLLYVFCPNVDDDGAVSSYSAYGMTVRNLTDMFEDFCTWKKFEELSEWFNKLSTYYYKTIRPIMLSAFAYPEQLTSVYMCRAQRTRDDFPYMMSKKDSKLGNDQSNKRKRDLKQIWKRKDNDGNDWGETEYKKLSAHRTKKLMYHEWADFNTKKTDVSSLAWLAPGGELDDSNAIAFDKYLEYRRQFILSLLLNRKRVIMAEANLYARAIKASREIRFKNTDQHDPAFGLPEKPVLQLENENKISEDGGSDDGIL